MKKEEIRALKAVLDYLWKDEKSHFESDKTDDHIFHELVVLKKYLSTLNKN